jgi:16S rRNA (adenine1518-N6/adenine1519-N6)-dimethyltransferase
VQKEVAERLSARPGNSGYGAATVLLGVRADCALVRKVPPDVFWPRPKVSSAVLRLSPREEPLVAAEEFETFAAFLRAVFSARRKRLARALGAARLTPAAARRALERSGVDGGLRPDALSPEGFAGLWRATL